PRHGYGPVRACPCGQLPAPGRSWHRCVLESPARGSSRPIEAWGYICAVQRDDRGIRRTVGTRAVAASTRERGEPSRAVRRLRGRLPPRRESNRVRDASQQVRDSLTESLTLNVDRRCRAPCRNGPLSLTLKLGDE